MDSWPWRLQIDCLHVSMLVETVDFLSPSLVLSSINVILALLQIILITTGVGLFEANALQFGLDQLLEAPTPKLIAFIHWYYWTHNAVKLVVVTRTLVFINYYQHRYYYSRIINQSLCNHDIITCAIIK